MHLHPRGDLPRDFMDAVDFYMYQSGHGATDQHQPYTFAEKFAAYPIKRPVLNSEPPYEGHGRVGAFDGGPDDRDPGPGARAGEAGLPAYGREDVGVAARLDRARDLPATFDRRPKSQSLRRAGHASSLGVPS